MERMRKLEEEWKKKREEELDELEKILKEKVEKDSEWDLLEIKSVRPIYLGKNEYAEKTEK